MSQLITINLSKSPGASWGFRLQGGKDFAQPLCVQKVNVGSLAEAAGLQAGDAIVSIGSNDALALRHKEAQDTIVKCGNSFQMVIQRGSMTWRPQVTALAQPKNTAQGPVATQTSLAAKQPPMPRMPKGFNATPQNFGEVNGQRIVNPQFNSPINIYSEDSLAEALTSQSEVLSKGCLGINFRKFDKEVKLRTDSPTYQLIHGDDRGSAGSPKPRKQLPVAQDAPQVPKPVFPAPQPGQPAVAYSHTPSAVSGPAPTRSVQAPVTKPRPEGAAPGGATLCSQCEKPIIGVFVRIKDKNLHAECFKCNTCATSLKNVGYYNINDKLYCDVHAKQAARHNPPAPNMVPVTVKPGAAPPMGAVPAAALHQPVQASTAGFGGSSANPAAFGAPSGGIDVRSHIPKKGPSSPAPSFITPKPAVAPAPAPSFIAPKPAAVPAPSFITPKPAAAPAPVPVFSNPAPSAMFGGGGMPKPVPPPGMAGLGGMPKAPGIGGKGVAGQRTAPKRGRGVMNPAQASRIPICASCQRQIRGPFVTALGKNWCPDHFHCATDTCRKPLIEVGFVEEQGRLHCEDCYEKFLAPVCGKCDKRIKGDCLNAVGKQFHPECFCCAYCGKIFGSGAFYLEDGLPYCETDWNDLFTTKCVGCGFPIEAGDRWVEALNNNYHSQCFKCSKCHKNLEGQSFFAKGGKPFCKAHAQRGF